MPWDEGVAPGVALGVGSSCIYMYSETKNQQASQGMRRGLNNVRMSDGTWRKVV